MNDRTHSTSKREQRAQLGIAGLDYILDGGLPVNHLYLIEGNPGTGKTTLALQYLIEGRAKGETGLYVTLSESQAELTEVATSHGWTLDGIEIHQMESLDTGLTGEDQYTVFHPAEIELNDTMKRICKRVEASNPTRVVFDSLSEMRLMARDSLRYRRQVLALKQFFVGRHCTVLLLDDNTSVNGDLQLQSISHGVIKLDRLDMDYGGARRRLHIPKMRGLHFRDGNHDYTIRRGGIEVFPRLVAAEGRKDPTAPSKDRKAVSSGVPGLDELLGGGLHCGTNALVIGPAGCGKSSVATQYAVAAAARGENAAVYLFEETRENYLTRSAGLGMDLTAAIESGLVIISQIDAAEVSPGEFAARLRTEVEHRRVTLVIIDSLNGYMNAMPNENFLLLQMHEILTYLNQHGVLTLVVMAQHGFMGTSMSAPVEISYLADTVIMLRYFEAFGHVKQAIAVPKKRTGSHERSIRQFAMSNNGTHVGPPLTEFHGVLTGVPEFQGEAAALRSENLHVIR